jgi:copper chaperone
MNTVTFNVPNINCMHCIHTIENELGDLPGVKSVDAELENKKVTVSFEAPASNEILVQTLTEINYPPAN